MKRNVIWDSNSTRWMITQNLKVGRELIYCFDYDSFRDKNSVSKGIFLNGAEIHITFPFYYYQFISVQLDIYHMKLPQVIRKIGGVSCYFITLKFQLNNS